jgi:hypothetical protein
MLDTVLLLSNAGARAENFWRDWGKEEVWPRESVFSVGNADDARKETT